MEKRWEIFGKKHLRNYGTRPLTSSASPTKCSAMGLSKSHVRGISEKLVIVSILQFSLIKTDSNILIFH